jgi:hypothetical protein
VGAQGRRRWRRRRDLKEDTDVAAYWTDKFSFVGGVVRNRTTVYVAMVSDEGEQMKIPQTLFTVWHKGQWLNVGEVRWRVSGMAVAGTPLEQLVATGEWGDVHCAGSGDMHAEHVAAGAKKQPSDRGPLRGARRIGSSIYVVGMDRQAYRRADANRWVELGPKPPSPASDPTGFEAVDGFNEQDIYAVGWDGEIWKFTGLAWEQLPSPTNLVLVDVCCAGNSSVYACGRQGFLIKGRDQAWDAVDTQGLGEDIWSLAWFNERLYFSTLYGVYTLEGNGVREVDMGAAQPKTCHRLSAEDGVLWSIGAKDVMAFDGTAWSRID